MIRLARLSGKEYVLNCELIKFIESTPDTLITLTTGEKLMVRNTLDEVVEATVRYRRGIFQSICEPATLTQPASPKENTG